tara:strand:- start:11 stop:559 length:549 start_codon:yes stop_codon:yes gene_type:complete
MNKLLTAMVGAAMLFATSVSAKTNTNYFDITGTVTSVDAIYSTVKVTTPQQVCEEKQVPIYANNGNDSLTGGQILGGIIGGVIGSKIGSGSGKDIAIGTGAIIGSQIGKNQENQNKQIVGYQTVTQCRTVNTTQDQTRMTGYNISFSTADGFSGTTSVTSGVATRYKVGDSIKLRVSLQPIF